MHLIQSQFAILLQTLPKIFLLSFTPHEITVNLLNLQIVKMYSIQKIPEESSCMQASAAHSTINLDSAGLLTGDIPDEFKCPICYEVPQAEIYQCTNGHTICSSCQSKNGRLCPHCRLPFHVESGLIRNRALETLLDSMIVPCPFKKDGCLDNVSRKNVKMHRINCIYK